MQRERNSGQAERRSGKQRHAQVKGSQIQCRDETFRLHAQCFGNVQISRDPNQRAKGIALRAQVAPPVGIGPIAARTVAALSDIIGRGGVHAKTRRDISQTRVAASATLRSWSGQVKIRTIKSPQFSVITRKRVYHGASNINWAKTSLPAYIAILSENQGIPLILGSVVQVINA